ncbi:Eco57I restriction-modification methylase domain-containing protein [Picosynechococcus sp. PCC 73109]|uniref:Eco57I restriction-modification methylase domain-containing protein n=1 Tax=Picosynechococcus sp. PCC 73109 TaxID=374982 RepID=UPI000745901E|nr:DNA methyltransferase [Picosynechococcus sp. PCC 73109]AMA10692.1 hypothetical protein AWQ23_14690 [Picosynechococcus sp. PCC 73109]
MKLNRKRTEKYLKDFDFESLFIEELGWDTVDAVTVPLEVDEAYFEAEAIAQKRGFTVYQCICDEIPQRRIRVKLDRELTTVSKSHLLIFGDEAQASQVWMWVRQELGKPLTPRFEEYRVGQSTERILQKLEALAIAFEEEDELTLVEVNRRVRQAFDVDKTTKKFYKEFERQHKQFLKHIEGIDNEFDKNWYASLMLNRLMFVYFIQRKGFLNEDINYLQNRLKLCQNRFGDDKFYSFYRYFLLRLFHDGLGKSDRDQELDELLGVIPYLNGGFFDIHQLEIKYKNIEISDDAFEEIFTFFGNWDWHLDDRAAKNQNEINPDILGYIFEKYINQKQMGAYYTKEDITEYISKNTIIPFFFDAAKKKGMIAFDPNGEIWSLLQENPDRYIYDAVLKGVDLELPANIAAGIDDVSQRQDWNKSASEEFALPTEIWREHVARRQRCLEIREKLRSGEITSINDLITYNLNIRQFAQDVITGCEGSDFLLAFYRAVASVSVLDPTCGSGAFLFAALEILEPLYSGCLGRMRGFVEEDDRRIRGTDHKPRYVEFREILAEVEKHPNKQYFVLKSIMLNNLYGVDIMEEATEICKLRLFLKLVAQVEPNQKSKNLGLEPLPDIDFNIRAGNTLVGFTSRNEVYESAFRDSNGQTKLLFDDGFLKRIEQGAVAVDMEFKRFKSLQTQIDIDGKELASAKSQLKQSLAELRVELDRYLAEEYERDLSKKASAFQQWKESYQPFHWFVEFYGIINKGGFDVIIGNPPYVELKDVKTYTLKNFQTLNCRDLYSYTVEQSYKILNKNRRVGLIIPISMFGTDGFSELQSLSLDSLKEFWVSCFANRPSQLFNGAQKRLTILLGCLEKNNHHKTFSTSYLRWNCDEREELFFSRIHYISLEKYFNVFPASLEKIGNFVEIAIFQKMLAKKEQLGKVITQSENHLYYTRKFGYFLSFLNFVPEIIEIETNIRKLPSELKILDFNSSESVIITIAALSSSTFFWFWNILSDCRNLNKRDLLAFPFNPNNLSTQLKLSLLEFGKEYLKILKSSSKKMVKSGLYIQTFEYSKCKSILDEIDKILAQYYGFTNEELDFIINYDIKYRMGRDFEG